jgi:hypothetical protein
MTRMLLCALIVLGALGVGPTARSEGGASLTYCNHSMTHTIYIAEGWWPATATGAYRAAGWRKIEPNTCREAFSDLHTRTRFWIRALSENRLIRGTKREGADAARKSEDGFCTDSQVAFDDVWQTLDSARSDCAFGMPARLYPITVMIDEPGPYRIDLDPDPWIAKFPPVEEPKQEEKPGIKINRGQSDLAHEPWTL